MLNNLPVAGAATTVPRATKANRTMPGPFRRVPHPEPINSMQSAKAKVFVPNTVPVMFTPMGWTVAMSDLTKMSNPFITSEP